MTAAAIIGPKFYGFDNNGERLAGGKVFAYEPGTTTPKATYTDETATTANAHPVVLNAAGFASIYLVGTYKIVLKDASDVEIWTADPVTDATQLATEWIKSTPATQASPTTFTVDGNQAEVFVEGRRVRLKDSAVLYGYVSSASYVSPTTTVTVVTDDGGALTASLSEVRVSNDTPLSDVSYITTVTGSQPIKDALNDRVIYVDTIADLQALPTSEMVDGLQIVVKGYSSGMHSGGGLFYWDASSTTTENGFDVFGTATSGRFIRLPVGYYNADMAGIVDDPLLDQTGKYSTLLNRVPEGSTVDMLGYSVLLKSSVTITNSFKMVNGGSVITDYGLTFAGSYSLVGNLTASASEGDDSITYSGGDIAPGSLIGIHNAVDFSLNNFRANYHDGEFAVVDSVSAGVIKLSSPLLSSYPSGVTSKIFLIDPLSPSISDLVVRNEGAVSPPAITLDIKLCRNFELNNVNVFGGEARALGIVQSCIGVVNNCSGVNRTSPTTGTNYGISIVNSQSITISRGNFWGARHGTAAGGSGGDLIVPCRFINFHNCSVGSDNSHGADFHGNTIDSYYRDCLIYNGSGLSGKNVGIIGGVVKKGPTSTVFILNNVEHYGGSLTYSDITVDLLGADVSISGFSSGANTEITAESTTFSYNNIFIKNNQNLTVPPFTVYNQAANLTVYRHYDFSNISFERALNNITAGRLVNLSGGASYNPLRRLSIRGVAPDSLTYWFTGSGSVVTAATFTEVPVAGTGTV